MLGHTGIAWEARGRDAGQSWGGDAAPPGSGGTSEPQVDTGRYVQRERNTRAAFQKALQVTEVCRYVNKIKISSSTWAKHCILLLHFRKPKAAQFLCSSVEIHPGWISCGRSRQGVSLPSLPSKEPAFCPSCVEHRGETEHPARLVFDHTSLWSLVSVPRAAAHWCWYSLA